MITDTIAKLLDKEGALLPLYEQGLILLLQNGCKLSVPAGSCLGVPGYQHLSDFCLENDPDAVIEIMLGEEQLVGAVRVDQLVAVELTVRSTQTCSKSTLAAYCAGGVAFKDLRGDHPKDLRFLQLLTSKKKPGYCNFAWLEHPDLDTRGVYGYYRFCEVRLVAAGEGRKEVVASAVVPRSGWFKMPKEISGLTLRRIEIVAVQNSRDIAHLLGASNKVDN